MWEDIELFLTHKKANCGGHEESKTGEATGGSQMFKESVDSNSLKSSYESKVGWKLLASVLQLKV